MSNSGAENIFAAIWQTNHGDLPAPEREYRFHDTRKWRFDFAWPDEMLAVEIDGGIWVGGHRQDRGRNNAAQVLGWRVLRYTTDEMQDRPIQIVEQVANILIRTLTE